MPSTHFPPADRVRSHGSPGASVSLVQRDGKLLPDIQALSRVQVSGQRFLYVTHSGGQYAITAFMLPSKTVFEEVCELLAAKVQALRPAGSV
jgi:hypothetical protein